MQKLKTLFFGTPDITLDVLEFLRQSPKISLDGIVTMPDRPAGRGKKLRSPEVAEFAKNNDIECFQTANINKEDELLKELESRQYDIIIVFAFAQFLSDRVLNLSKLGPFNIHTSLLPKYRGAAPIQYALLNGDKTTGVSIQKMVKKMDAGDIAHSKSITIEASDNGESLYKKLKTLSKEALSEFIDIIINGSLTLTSQNEKNVSFAPTIKKSDGFIDFKNNQVESIKNKARAFFPWPGTFCLMDGKRLKIIEIENDSTSLTPGELSTEFGKLVVGCANGSLRLKKIQLEGKKASTDIELLNGYRGDFKLSPMENL